MSRVGFDIGVQHAGLSAVIYFCAQFGSSSSASRDDGGLWGRLLAHLNQDGDQDTALPPPRPSPSLSSSFFFYFVFFSPSPPPLPTSLHPPARLYITVPCRPFGVDQQRWTRIRPLTL